MDDRTRASQEVDELRRQIRFLKALPNASPIGLLVVDHTRDEIRYFNEAFISIWKAGHLRDRLDRNEVSCEDIIEHLSHQVYDPGAFAAYCRQIRASDELRVKNHMLKLADGRHICFHSTQIVDEDGQYQGRLYTFEEVTRTVKAEEEARKSDEQYRELADLLPQIVFEVDLAGKLTFVNRSAFELMGYTSRDFAAGLNVLDMIAPEDRKRARENIRRVLNGDKSGQEYTFQRKDGSRFPVRVHSAVIFRDGKPAGLRGFIVDITEQKAAEARLQRLSAAIEQSPSSVMIFDTEGTVVYVNPQFSRITGYTSEDTVGKSLFGLSFANARPEQLDDIAHAIKSGREWLGEIEYETKSGRSNWVSAHIFPIRDECGKITHFIDVEEDITERKTSDRELQKLLMALDQSPNSITIADSTGKITYVNSAFTRLTGARREDVVGKTKLGLSGEGASQGRIGSILDLVRSGKDWKSERRITKTDGADLWVSVQISPIRDAGGNVEYLVIIEEDITERKQAEEKLLLTQASIDSFHDPCMWSGEDGQILYVNDAACQVLGYSREELLRMKIQDIDPSFHDDKYRETFVGLKTQGSIRFESVHSARDGRTFPVEISTKMVRFGDRDYAVSIERDITERKKAEAELRKLSVAVEQSPASVKIVAADRTILYVNPKFTEMFGYPQEEVLGKLTGRVPAAIQDSGTIPDMVRAIMAGKEWHGEIQYLKKNGLPFWVRSYIAPIRDEAGNILNYIEISEDITERKLAEKKLADNLHFLQLLIDTIPVPVYYKDAHEIYIGCNNAFEKFLGRSKDEIIGKTAYDIAPRKLADVYHEADMAMLSSGEDQSFESKVRYADGNLRNVIFYKAVFKGADGKPAGIIGTLLDITERKLNEERIQNSLQEKEVLLKEVHHRVKNNMQIISSLLSLQLSGIDQEPVRQILEESQNRIRSIALVHERMYKSEDLSRIDFSEYLKNMCSQLLITYMSTPERVKMEVEGASIHLGVDQAVPCGLILNELISNSLKHAFPGSRPGTVKIHLSDRDGHTITVHDDGIGVPDDFNLADAQSMGMQLVSALVEQLEGTITLHRTEPGTRFTITFPAKKNVRSRE